MSDETTATKLVPLRLLQNYGAYNSTEVAGFPPDEAAKLVAEGIAEPYVPGSEKAPDTVGSTVEEGEPEEKKSGRKK